MRNLIDKYQENIFDLGTGYFDLSGQIGNDRIILNLYKSEYINGLSAGIVLNLDSTEVSTFGKGGFDLNCNRLKSYVYYSCDGDEYSFLNNDKHNQELGLYFKSGSTGKILYNDKTSSIEQYYEYFYNSYNYLTRIINTKNNNEIIYSYDNGVIKSISNNEAHTNEDETVVNLNETIAYTYNEEKLCTKITIERGNIILYEIELTYDEDTKFISSIKKYKHENNVSKLEASYDINLGIYFNELNFVDNLTSLTKSFILDDRNCLVRVNYENGLYVDTERGVFIPSYATNEEDILKTKVTYHYDSNNRIMDIERYNNIHSLRKYEDNKLLLSCDACFKDVNYLGKLVARINSSMTNVELLTITDDEESPINLIGGLDNNSLFKMLKDTESNLSLEYDFMQEETYTAFVIIDDNNFAKLKFKIIAYNGDQIVEESREYIIENKYFAYSFKLPRKALNLKIEISCCENQQDKHVIFNTFVIDKGICNVYTYDADNLLIKKLVNGIEQTFDSVIDQPMVVYDDRVVSYSKGKIESQLSVDGISVFNEYNEEDQLTKITKKINGQTFEEESRTYNESKQLKTVGNTLFSSNFQYEYNDDYSLLSVIRGTNKVKYEKDENIPKIANIEFSNNTEILKKHGFTYNNQILSEIKENDISKYKYVYDNLKRITAVLLGNVLIEGYKYDSRFPYLITRKSIEGFYENYYYDIFQNVVAITRYNSSLDEIFTFKYNEDNLLTEVKYNDVVIEEYYYSYGRLTKSIINGVTVEYIRNEKDEVVDKQITYANNKVNIRQELSECSRDNIFKYFKDILIEDENTYGTLFLDEKLLKIPASEAYYDPTYLMNKNGLNFWYIKDSSYKYYDKFNFENGYPSVNITSDCTKVPVYSYYCQGNQKFFFTCMLRLSSNANTTILTFSFKSVYTFKLDFKLDSNGYLNIYSDGALERSPNCHFEPNKFYNITFYGDGTYFYLRVNNETVFNESMLSSINQISFELGKPDNVGAVNNYGLVFLNRTKILDFLEIQYMIDRFNNIIERQTITESSIKSSTNTCHTIVEENVNYDEISFSNTNISKNGIKPISEYRKINSSRDSSYIYDNDLKGICLNKMGLGYDLGLRQTGTISFKGKVMSNTQDTCLLTLKDNYDCLRIIYYASTNKFSLESFGFEKKVLDVDPFIWHNYVLTWSMDIPAESTENTIITVCFYIDGVLKYSSSPVLEETDNSSNLGVYLNVSNKYNAYTVGNCRISSLKYTDTCLTESEVASLINKKIFKFTNYYNSLGQLLCSQITKNDTNIHTHTYDYDSKLRVSSEFLHNDFYGYTYDDKNNLLRYSKNGVIYDYGYDDNNRLIYESKDDSETKYIYDQKDNLVQISVDNVVKKRFTFDSLGRIIGCNNKAITYLSSSSFYPIKIVTDQGYISLTWHGSQLYEYREYIGTSLKNYLIFEYDQFGLRTKKINVRTNKITYYFYDENNNLVIENSRSDILRYYYDSNNTLVAFSIKNEMFFYERDAFGNIKHIFDSNNQIVVSYDYKAFGQDMVVSGTLAETLGLINPFRFKGYYYDVETGLFWLSSRYYSPELCRFISPDDVGYLDPTSINGLNLYAYCMNDPINYADPSGHWVETVFDLFSLGVSIVEVIINPYDPLNWAGLAGDALDLIPFVTGVGETVRGVKVVAKGVDMANDVYDTIKIMKVADLTDDAWDTVRGLDRAGDFTQSSMSAGRRIHKGYKTFDIDGKEFRRFRGIRLDYFDEAGRLVYELKPYNINSLKAGVSQLARYRRRMGKGYTWILELY